MLEEFAAVSAHTQYPPSLQNPQESLGSTDSRGWCCGWAKGITCAVCLLLAMEDVNMAVKSVSRISPVSERCLFSPIEGDPGDRGRFRSADSWAWMDASRHAHREPKVHPPHPMGISASWRTASAQAHGPVAWQFPHARSNGASADSGGDMICEIEKD